MNRSIVMGMTAAVLVIAAAFPVQTYSATVSSGTVKAKSGFVRSAASSESAVAFCVSSGNEVAILSEEKGKDGKTWYKVAVGTSTGYIRSDLVSKTDKKTNVSDAIAKQAKASSAAPDNQSAKTAAQQSAPTTAAASATSTAVGASAGTVKGTSVRMRKNASVNSGVVTYLENGAVLAILAEGKAEDGQVWYQVRSGDQTGFIRSDLVTKTGIGANTASSTAAATTAGALANTNTTTTVTASTDSTSGNVVKTIEPGTGLVKGDNVRIRSNASTAGDIVTTVSTGCELKLTGVERTVDREWVKVETTVQGKSVSGYIARDFVTVTKEVKVVTQTTQTLVGSDGAANGRTVSSTDNKDPEEKDEKNDTGPGNAATRVVADDTGPGNTASVKGVGVRVRQAPVDGGIVCQLSSGHPLTITDESEGSDDYTWYQVSFSYLGSEKNGFIRSDLVVKTEKSDEDAPVGDDDFEESISSLPDSYKNGLRALYAKHPQWKFEVVDTGLEWKDALKAESSVGKNLVSKNSIASWKSTAPQAYNQASNQWYTFDGGSWASASPELIAYYMDPRNFLNESGIYMFEKLDFSDTQTKESVSKMLTGTFMSGEVTDSDGATFNYAEKFREVGEQTGVSPYLLAGRALQEQGIKGSSQSISGAVPGHEGIYNYFNVGAYAYSGRSATVNGIIYASGSDEEYLRPWNTRARAIYGGAKYLSEKFVSKGQNTLYFQKFNVVNRENTLYSHQYMSNIQAASSESSRLQLAYLGDDEVLTFRIPYYHNMPETLCEKPVSDSNPNTYLASLSISGYELTPAFSGVTDKYVITVDPGLESVKIEASAVCASSSVGGVGEYPIQPGTNTLYVSCKAQNGAVKTYTITVYR
ncbi:MAG: SH3 domain-containing protein [Lachnospiraceae bacterium]|nr:SH3 domain-containing protein [Lachnospiraceae bacterium]